MSQQLTETPAWQALEAHYQDTRDVAPPHGSSAKDGDRGERDGPPRGRGLVSSTTREEPRADHETMRLLLELADAGGCVSVATRCSAARRSTSPRIARCCTWRCARPRGATIWSTDRTSCRRSRGARPDGGVRGPACAAATGGTPASHPQRRQHRHRRLRSRPGMASRRCATTATGALAFRFVSNVDGADFVEATRDLIRPRRCSSSPPRRSRRSRR